MAEPGLTACLIVKDEAAALPSCLAALDRIRPVLREICVYDTGSGDGTPELARRSGCRVVEGYWDDDFARARNAAMDLAQTDWVLSIDADEQLVTETDRMRRLLEFARRERLDTLVLDMDDVRDGVCVSSSPLVRMFRPDVAQFRNRVHEIIAARNGSTLRGARVGRPVAHIAHHGYGPSAAMERRRERNSRLGDVEVSELLAQGADADRLVEALVNRGRSRSIGGEQAAGIEDWESARRLATTSPFRTWAGELLASAHIERRDFAAVSSILTELSREGSDPEQLAWLAGRAFAAAGQPREALECLRQVTQPTSALGLQGGLAPVLQARMMAAAEVGDTETAIEAALPLLARHGVVHGFGRLVLLCWAPRPPEALAARLLAEGVAHRTALVQEFARWGEAGLAVSAALADEGPQVARPAPLAGLSENAGRESSTP